MHAPLSAEFIQTLSQRLIGFSLFFENIELLANYRLYCKTENPAWDWNLIRREFIFFPKPIRFFFDFMYQEKVFLFIVIMRVLIALSWVFAPSFNASVVILFFLQFLFCLRFRGSFHGGSDFMTTLILIGFTIGFYTRTKAGLYYIALQSICSYFFAGLIKIKRKNWRNANALKWILLSARTNHGSKLAHYLKTKTSLATLISLSVVGFEIIWPIALSQRSLLIFFFIFSALFHFNNFLILGLNRFFFVWISTYPSIYFLAQRFWQ